MRENEFHLLNRTAWFSWPFVVLTSKNGFSAATTTAAAHSAASLPERRAPGAEKACAAPMPPASPANSTAFGAPIRFNVGINRRQPDAAPRRSAAYTALTRLLSLEMAIEMTAPPAKKGIAETRYVTLISAIFDGV